MLECGSGSSSLTVFASFQHEISRFYYTHVKIRKYVITVDDYDACKLWCLFHIEADDETRCPSERGKNYLPQERRDAGLCRSRSKWDGGASECFLHNLLDVLV